jgi:hypothetical protein
LELFGIIAKATTMRILPLEKSFRWGAWGYVLMVLLLLGAQSIALIHAAPAHAYAAIQSKASQPAHNAKSTKSASPISTSASTSIGTLTLTLDNAGDTFVYGQSPTPTFTVTLVFAVAQHLNLFRTAQVKMDSGETFGGTLDSTDNITFTTTVYTRGFTIRAGQRTATASFTDAPTNTTIYSAPIAFAIQRAPINFVCGINYQTQFSQGQTVTVAMSYEYTEYPPLAPVDWKNATYGVTLRGPTTISYSNLAPDANDDVMVQLPTTIGTYTLSCTFSGTSLFLPESITITNSPVVISEKKALAAQLYTNPTTLVAGQPADFYLVLHPANGLPAPTGQVQFTMGQYYTNYYNLTNGILSLHFDTIPPLQGITTIFVNYTGDQYYTNKSFTFPLTNPPIPSGTGAPQATVGSTAKATGTATATASVTATATTTLVSATPTVTSATNPASRTTSSNAWVLLVVGILIVLLLAGGATGLVIWRRRIIQAKAGAIPQDATIPVLPSGDIPEQTTPPNGDTIE